MKGLNPVFKLKTGEREIGYIDRRHRGEEN